jgi:hypothetical protein
MHINFCMWTSNFILLMYTYSIKSCNNITLLLCKKNHFMIFVFKIFLQILVIIVQMVKICMLKKYYDDNVYKLIYTLYMESELVG